MTDSEKLHGKPWFASSSSIARRRASGLSSGFNRHVSSTRVGALFLRSRSAAARAVP